MSKILPSSRPKASKADIVGFIPPYVFQKYKVILVGYPAYYLNSMGKPGVNDRGIYDDAIFLIAPDAFLACNANVDPSVYRKGIAKLMPGVHLYRKGKHKISSPKGYAAFRPATPDESLPVMRDGQVGEKKGIAINIHKGGVNGTSSLGCQTIHPSQWSSFQSTAYMLLDRY